MQDTAHAAKDLNGPLRQPSRRSPRAGFAPLEDACLPRAGSVPFEGVRSPRAGSAPLEGPLPLEQTPPRSRVRLGLDRSPLRSRAPPPACACPRTLGIYRSDTGVAAPSCARGSRPGAAKPTPQEGAHSHHYGKGLCDAAGVSPVTPCACASTANAPSPRKGAGFTLDLLSCDPTGLGGGARLEERHPCHCYSMAAAPARASARPALWQQLRYGGVYKNGTPFYLPLYSVRANVSSSLEPIRRHHRRPPLLYPRTATIRVQDRP
jgi:hypothetical protein